MIDRIILGAVLSVTGYHGVFPDPPSPPTPLTLKAKAKERSLSQVCSKKSNKKQSETVKRICKEWKEQQRA
jgi:hypothetical protein